MKNLYLVFFIFFMVRSVFAATTIYIDPDLPGGTPCSGDYSISSNNCTGSDGDAYATMEEVIWGTNGTNGILGNGTGTGYIIYLRGGTYTEDWGNSGDPQAQMQIHPALNGTAWTDGNFNTLTSYPGEWAILDFSASRVFGLGAGDKSTPDEADHLAYWKFERLELQGASHGGLAVLGGPVWVRYCYIHSNGMGSADADDNRGGIHARLLHNSIIEYNYFTNNSGNSSNNRTHIIIYGDYIGDVGIDTEQNEIRYNNFSPGANAPNQVIKHKGGSYWIDADNETAGFDQAPTAQMIIDNGGRGERYHHNFIDGTGASRAMELGVEYSQVYQNIVLNATVGTERCSSTCVPIYGMTHYNNTLIGNNAQLSADCTYGSGYWNYNPIQPFYYAVNNVSDSVADGEYTPPIGILTMMRDSSDGDKGGDLSWTGSLIDRNLIHDADDTGDEIGIESSYGVYPARTLSVSTFNTQRSTTNYSNTTADLFLSGSGYLQYVTDGTFIVGGSTISTGGLGTSHPYLSETFPSFVGATNPDDYAWVDGVVNDLTSVAWLTSISTDRDEDDNPTWIEGAATEAGTTATIQGVTFSPGVNLN